VHVNVDMLWAARSAAAKCKGYLKEQKKARALREDTLQTA